MSYQRTGVSFAPPERVGARESAKSAQGSGVAQGVTPLPVSCDWCRGSREVLGTSRLCLRHRRQLLLEAIEGVALLALLFVAPFWAVMVMG